MNSDELKQALFEFLQSDASAITLEELGEISREAAKAKLRELIPVYVEVKQICNLESSIVTAAPHIHFDGWTGRFSRLAASEFSTGRVSAYNYRDDNGFDIPVSIDRHIHVNRPTESAIPYGEEKETQRARDVFEQYVQAITQAGAKGLPLDLLIEFHGQRRNERIEIATIGLDKDLAERLLDAYHENPDEETNLPELRIEPLHRLHFSAVRTKQDGVMRSEIARQAIQVELPRSLRRPESNRVRTWNLLRPIIKLLIEQHTDAH